MKRCFGVEIVGLGCVFVSFSSAGGGGSITKWLWRRDTNLITQNVISLNPACVFHPAVVLFDKDRTSLKMRT